MRARSPYGPLLLALAMLFEPIAASPTAAQQPIRIGASAAITGRDSVQGGYFREGYLLCQKHVNEKGGVLGRPIQLLLYDDTSEPPVAARLYEKLIAEDKVDAILGPYGSPMTEAVADVVEKHRKVMVAPGAGTTAIWEKGRRYLIMLLSPLESSTEGTIDLAARNHLKTIAVLGSMARPAIAKGAVEIAKKKGLDVVVHEMFPGGTTDFSVILNKVKAARPEALVVGAPPADAIAISRPVRELDVNVKLYGVTPGAAYPDFQKALGKTADFVYAVPTGSPVSRTPVIRSSSPRTRKSSVARPPRTRPGPTRVANSSSTPSGGQEPWTRTPSVEHC